MTLKVTTFSSNCLKHIRRYKYISGICVLVLILIGAWLIKENAETRYKLLLSNVVYDRNGIPLSIAPNSKGHYVLEIPLIPEEFKKLIIQKEDRFFYYHFGINPFSILRASYNYVTKGKAGGSSTLTQQLAKNLLGTEIQRNGFNKIVEVMYALSIELYMSKEQVLLMYANTVYLGNQTQGFDTASYAYFNKPLRETTHSERISLLATLSYPSSRNPWERQNRDFAVNIHNRISPTETFIPPETTLEYSFQRDSSFELRTAGIHCEETCITTIDDVVTEAIRNILDRHIRNGWERNVRNGAVVVINPRTEELIAMVGSRNPKSTTSGNQINMAIEPRPIGSTVKPFIYVKGFEMGLRPYTIVEDREYKYPIATGYSLYPKNYDGQYHGKMTLHEALSNSFNVPSVKVLEYIGLDTFYRFMSDKLRFSPIQEYDSYQYGIALGGLEMDLTTLTHYFSLFPRRGSLAPLKVLLTGGQNFDLPPQSDIEKETEIVPEEYTELVHRIISDRLTGVNQFGLEGSLNLTSSDYGVKTGTSRDFHDSWVVGYTGDFVVGVWLGNSENEALDQVSGSSGAGAAWHEVMEYLLTSEYNENTPITLKTVQNFVVGGSDEWGLMDDVIEEHSDLLLDDTLILSLHEGDVFERIPNLTIPLRARKEVKWKVNGEKRGSAIETSFSPLEAGIYTISAYDSDKERQETVLINVTSIP